MAAVLTLLAQAGISSYTVCHPSDFVRRSRWYRKLPTEGTPSSDNLAELLERLPIERAILMPCSDDWLTVVAALPASLAARLRACDTPWFGSARR